MQGKIIKTFKQISGGCSHGSVHNLHFDGRRTKVVNKNQVK